MKITIITHGIPNSHSEQANNDPLLFCKYFEKKKIKFDLISIWDHDYNTSGKGRKFQEKSIRNNFKQLQFFKVLNYKKKNKILRFFMRIFSSKPYYFYGDKNIYTKVMNIIEKKNSKIILNFLEFPASIFAGRKNLNIFNYLGVARKNSELLRIKNIIKKKSFFSLLILFNAYIYVLKIDKIYHEFLISAKLNFCAAVDSYVKFKDIYKNVYFSGPLSNDRSNIKKKEHKLPIVLMIGALNSNFMQDSLSMVASIAPRLNEIYKKKKFKLRIVGKSRPADNILKNLNYPWVEFAGWVESSSKEYQNATFLFCPNSVSVGPRTKILESAASKVCIITTTNNIKSFFPYFKNNRDMIIGKNMIEFCKGFERILFSKKNRLKMINSAKKKYDKYYSPHVALENNLRLIKKYSNV